jgi:hypothetical protein
MSGRCRALINHESLESVIGNKNFRAKKETGVHFYNNLCAKIESMGRPQNQQPVFQSIVV